VHRLVELEHGLQAAVVLPGKRLPRGARARTEDLLDLDVSRRARALELRSDELLASHPPAPRLPELRLERPQADPAVGAFIWRVADQRSGQGELAAARNGAIGEIGTGHHRQPR